MIERQLDLFENDKFIELENYIYQLKKSQENIRKGIFARHHDLSAMIIMLVKRIDELESRLEQKEELKVS